MRTIRAQLAVVVLTLTAMFAAPSSATAQAPGAKIAPGTCSRPAPYPPSPDATIESSTTTPVAGQHIEASGIHYCPDEDVMITIAGQMVGTAHTDSAGAFDPDVVVPGPPGDKQLCGIGASGLTADADCLTLHVRAGGGASASPVPGSTGGTAFTGAQVALLAAVALILIAGGVAFATAGRSRKSFAQP